MNWQKRYEKVKVGDTVRCIKNPTGRISSETITEGGGWEEGYTFIIKNITGPFKEHEDMRILWPKGGVCGIYEDYVEIIKKGKG